MAKIKATPRPKKVKSAAKCDGLTIKQALFINEYMVDFNATQAAIRAGYSENTAQEISSENLSKPLVAREIKKRIKARIDRLGITADNVLQGVNGIAKDKKSSKIARLKAYEILAKRLTLYKDNPDSPTPPVSVNFNFGVEEVKKFADALNGAMNGG